MPEVVLAVIKEMRESGEVEKLICSHFEHNEQSKRVIENVASATTKKKMRNFIMCLICDR